MVYIPDLDEVALLLWGPAGGDLEGRRERLLASPELLKLHGTSIRVLVRDPDDIERRLVVTFAQFERCHYEGIPLVRGGKEMRRDLIKRCRLMAAPYVNMSEAEKLDAQYEEIPPVRKLVDGKGCILWDSWCCSVLSSYGRVGHAEFVPQIPSE